MSANLGLVDNTPRSVAMFIQGNVSRRKRNRNYERSVGKFVHEVKRVYKYHADIDYSHITQRAKTLLTTDKYQEFLNRIEELKTNLSLTVLRSKYARLREFRTAVLNNQLFIDAFEKKENRYKSLQNKQNRSVTEEEDASELHTELLAARADYLKVKHEFSKFTDALTAEKLKLGVK